MRFAVLASGQGSLFESLCHAMVEQKIGPANIALLATNKPQCSAVTVANQYGVTVEAIDHTSFSSRQAFDKELLAAIRSHGIDAIVLAGFMRILTTDFVSAFAGKMINSHPSLLPAFPGAKAVQQALDHGVKITGCTVHFVTEGVDEGPIIAQRAVEVLPADTSQSLQDRIKQVEKVLLPEVVSQLAQGKLQRMPTQSIKTQE